jgi:acyl transferase domain-containing protein/NADPH:quinone reductase-like Zn-dependent oxidoreductase/short-subunit dehydrogenase
MSKAPEEVLSAAKLALAVKRQRSVQPDSDLVFSEPIAVVGIGCRFPGGVRSADEYWQFLHGYGDAISEIPADRWDADRYYSPDSNAEGKMNTRWGGFLKDIDQFDASFFGVSPREASAMDPQQRLLLEVVWETLWDAGIAPDRLGGTSTGVFMGVYGTDYARLLLEDFHAIGSHTCAGAAHSMASGRISFLLDLQGPSITVDTACSSSLVAVHLACQSLRAGSCRMALAGGVSLKLRPEHYLCLSKLGMTSPEGRCRTFDANGNGFVPGEGCGVVLLRPLTDALMEGQQIYAVIRGAATNQDGHTNFLTAPSGLAQQRVIRSAIENARISPADISYVEAHGTGTRLGDPIEVEALAEVIGSIPFEDRPCALGSVKTNLGHLEAASGIAGFIKAALALHHEEIPPNLHYQRLNPLVILEGTRFYVPVVPTPWPRSARGRFAGVSSFGFSGTNAHVVLEEAPRVTAGRSGVEASPGNYLLAISARTTEACDQLARAYRGFLNDAGRDLPLYDICHSASQRRSHYEERLAITAASSADLCTRLDDYLERRTRPGIVRGRATTGSTHIIFVFSGQGSQWSQMGLQLYEQFPTFRTSLDECDAQIRRFAGWSVIDVLSATSNELTHTEYVQPALFALEVSLAKLWQSWGIQPSAVLGHSVGEAAAAHIAGGLSLATAARVVVLRGRLMQPAAGQGKMAVIYEKRSVVQRELGPFEKVLSIACVNGPHSTVVSGEAAALDELIAQLRDRGITSRPVRVDYAFHSPQMQPYSEAVARHLGSFPREPMQVPMISTVTGRRTSSEDLDADYWARNVRQPVLFEDAIRTAAAMGGEIFLEIGPHPVLLDSIADCLEPDISSGMLIGSMRRETDESEAVLSALGKLYVAGYPVAWEAVYPKHAPPVKLPTYPFQRQRIWLEAPGHKPSTVRRPMAINQIRSPGLANEVFEFQVGLESMPYLADHRIAGNILLPMTAFIEIARQAIQASGRAATALSDFVVVESLVIQESQNRTIQVVLQGESFRVFSLNGDNWILHATGRSVTGPGRESSEPGFEHCEYGDASKHYRMLADSGADFGPSFQTVYAISAAEGCAWTRVRLGKSESSSAGDYLLHPALLDGCLQSVIPAMPADQRDGLYVPFSISDLTIRGSIEGEATARAKLRSESTPESVLADVDIWRGEELVASISGLRMNRLHPSAHLDSKIYEVRWHERGPGIPVRPIGGDWLILSDDGVASSQLSQELTRLGCHVTRRPSGAPPDGIPGLRAVVKVYDVEQDCSMDAAIHGCTSALALVSGVLKSYPSDPPQLWLVTRGAANLFPKVFEGLTQSSVIGLARTIAMEHPELRCARIDVDETPASMECIAKELASWDGEEETAYRNGCRYVPRLQRAATASSQLKRWKMGATGSIENLEIEPVSRRAPGPGEIDVDVDASALNFRDVLTVLGMYPGPPPPLGLEFCGRVVRTGEGVTTYKLGDRVAGIAWGSFSSCVCTPAALTFPAPSALSSLEAVTLPNAFLTAQYCLGQLCELRAGQRILIHAATGGVGLAAVQLARLAGAEIFASAGSHEKREYLRSLGVKRVYNSRSLDFVQEISAATGGQGVDVVLNSLSGDFIPAGFAVLGKGGRFIEIGKNGTWSKEQASIHRADCRYFLVDLAAVIDSQPEIVQRHFAEICDLLERDEITALPAHIYDFEDAPQAFRLLSQARHIGKVVLRHGAGVIVRADRTYLITGGLGAIGLSAAKWLADSGARHLVLVGRRPLSESSLAAVRSIEQRGVEITARSADVGSREELGVVVTEILATMPVLGGVIHAAGVLEDGVIEQQTPERIRRVMVPKVEGALNLHELTKGAPLDFFFLFSSLAGITGSPGQSGYSAANAWMDALAHKRHREGLPALSINWGPWSGGGMASEVEAGGKRRSLPGLKPMSPGASWKCLENAVKLRKCEIAITDADWEQWAPKPSILSDLTRTSPGRVPEQSVEQTLKKRLESTPVQNRRALLLEWLRTQARQILGLSPSYFVDEREPLVRMGLDSLMAVEFRNQLSAALERPLMATLLFDHPSLSALANYLLGAEKVVATKHDFLLEELHSLSDAEAEELLKHELESS